MIDRDRWSVSSQLRDYKDFHNKSTVIGLQSDEVSVLVGFMGFIVCLVFKLLSLIFTTVITVNLKSGNNYEMGDIRAYFLISNKLHSTCWIFNLTEE